MFPSKTKTRKIVIGLTAALIFICSLLSSQESKNQSDQIAQAYKNLSNKNEEIADLYRKLAMKTEENLKMAIQSKNLQAKITETVTGGDSFPIVNPIFTELKPGGAMFPSGLLLSIRGKTIYDLTVIVTDLERLREIRGNTVLLNNMNNYQYKFQPGTIGSAYEEQLIRFPVGNKSSFTFHIQSFARNGQFNERILLRKVKDKWFSACCEYHDKKMVVNYVEPGFPRNELKDLGPNAPAI